MKVLLEPVYSRLFDIGTAIEVKDGVIMRQFMVENFINQGGSFAGGAGCSDIDRFKRFIETKYSYSLKQLQKITLDIAKVYLSMGAISNVQIDSFVYRDRSTGLPVLYPLVEVNYRKTMGLVIQSLADRRPDADWVEWRLETQKTIKERKQFHTSSSSSLSSTAATSTSTATITSSSAVSSSDIHIFDPTNGAWTKLSPDGCHFQGYYRAFTTSTSTSTSASSDAAL